MRVWDWGLMPCRAGSGGGAARGPGSPSAGVSGALLVAACSTSGHPALARHSGGSALAHSAGPGQVRAADRPVAEAATVRIVPAPYQLPSGVAQAAVLPHGSDLLILGGLNQRSKATASVLRLNPVTGSTTPAGRPGRGHAGRGRGHPQRPGLPVRRRGPGRDGHRPAIDRAADRRRGRHGRGGRPAARAAVRAGRGDHRRYRVPARRRRPGRAPPATCWPARTAVTSAPWPGCRCRSGTRRWPPWATRSGCSAGRPPPARSATSSASPCLAPHAQSGPARRQPAQPGPARDGRELRWPGTYRAR